MNNLAHFAINADDVTRARKFYETIFGWKAESYGPPDFFLLNAGDGVRGALQKRRELAPGKKMNGFECTVAVTDVDKTAAAVKKAGGRILMEKTTLVGVGDLIFFEDTEGNVCGAMRYDKKAE